MVRGCTLSWLPSFSGDCVSSLRPSPNNVKRGLAKGRTVLQLLQGLIQGAMWGDTFVMQGTRMRAIDSRVWDNDLRVRSMRHSWSTIGAFKRQCLFEKDVHRIDKPAEC